MLLFWHQKDLRVEENLALYEAWKIDKKILPVFILSPEEKLGAATKWWLHYSLEALAKDYAKKGAKLVIKKGDPVLILKKLLEKTKAEGIYYNQTFEKREKRVEKAFKGKVASFNGNHLVGIPHFFNKSGKPFAVFTPFYQALKKELHLPKGSPQKFGKVPPLRSDSLTLLPTKKWDTEMKKFWKPGRAGALKRIKNFHAGSYAVSQEKPAVEGTSFLSPHLHFGEVSPAEVWRKIKNPSFRRQLAWREFGAAFVYHFPKTPTQNWNVKFKRFPWTLKPSQLKKWQQGKTGYPLVDASMRQLWKLGWMHNRMRMVVASFLVKDLKIHWKKGAAWFWDTLVDADLGNNTLGWQWVAGCGPDAAPFFRIFNPVLQGEKFDPEGKFVKLYCPELKNLPKKWIHKPWEAPEEVLQKAQVVLGKNYPQPMVDHKVAREEALKAYKTRVQNLR